MFDTPQLMPYGTWTSPISIEKICSESTPLFFVDIDENYMYYDIQKLTEEGRTSIVKQKFEMDLLQTPIEILPKNFNARTKVHEYGGKSFFINGKDIFFIQFKDQRIYKIDQDKISPITPVDENIRYANLIFDQRRNFIYCVQEEHGDKVVNSIIRIDLKTSEKITIESGFDFYSSLCLSPDGKKFAFICWNLPNMPWDGSKLILKEIDEDGSFKPSKEIAGNEDESIFQPSFSFDNTLYFVSDRSGFYNIYRFDQKIYPVFNIDAEIGVPEWFLGVSTYCFVKKEDRYTIFCAVSKKDKDYLYEIDPINNQIFQKDLPFTYLSNLRSNGKEIIFIGACDNLEKSVILYDVKKNGFKIIKKPREVAIEEGYISKPRLIEYKSGDHKSFAYFYPPKNKDYISKDELPPLIVRAHGGPTSKSLPILNLDIQFWTSRGYAFCDVNYSGSSGYGREYRNLLNHNWGVYDVEDCVNAALYLIEENLVDKNRLIIKGASAGGFTTLAALSFKKVFNAGVSYFGISDLEKLKLYTHKFESGYVDTLIGDYPKEKEIFYQRSPINFVDQIKVPVLILQGEEDKIVPKEQAEIIYTALVKNNIATSYLLFEKEGHGFRDGKNIKKSFEAELSFYSQIFNLKPCETIAELKIQNLP